MEKFTTQIRRALASRIQLEKIKIGDFVEDEFGKSGRVSDIEKIRYTKESHYYFYLKKGGTILVII